MKVIGLGAGGHAKVVLEVLASRGDIEVVGLLDSNPAAAGRTVGGVRVLGGDDLLAVIYREGITAVAMCLGGASSTSRRRLVFEEAIRYGFRPVAVIHRHALISPSAILGEGPTVLAGAIVGTATRLGRNVLINTGAILDHDVVVGDHVHAATGARLAGGVIVDEGAHIGVGATVREGRHIGRGALVAAGAVVVDNVPPGVVVAGVPARVLRRVTDA
jgi:sugar O-acyltransferase (sialic acid O-acetyltransferase NeuD family)